MLHTGGHTAANLIEALPCPVIVVDAGQAIIYANGAAEYFFAASQSVLKRLRLMDVVPFSSPLMGLLAQAGERPDQRICGACRHPRTGGERVVDVQAVPVPDEPGTILMVLLERAAAERLDQAAHPPWPARSVSGLASMLAHEIKNRCPAYGARHS